MVRPSVYTMVPEVRDAENATRAAQRAQERGEVGVEEGNAVG